MFQFWLALRFRLSDLGSCFGLKVLSIPPGRASEIFHHSAAFSVYIHKHALTGTNTPSRLYLGYIPTYTDCLQTRTYINTYLPTYIHTYTRPPARAGGRWWAGGAADGIGRAGGRAGQRATRLPFTSSCPPACLLASYRHTHRHILHAHSATLIHSCIPTRIHTHIHTYTYIHACIHTHIRTYMHV